VFSSIAAVGGHAFALADRGAMVTGIDISDVAVAQAQRRAAAYSSKDLQFMKGDAEALDFADGRRGIKVIIVFSTPKYPQQQVESQREH
jgi:ubiquinone/menaquinone biosynthesis C-methylase UbiE